MAVQTRDFLNQHARADRGQPSFLIHKVPARRTGGFEDWQYFCHRTSSATRLRTIAAQLDSQDQDTDWATPIASVAYIRSQDNLADYWSRLYSNPKL